MARMRKHPRLFFLCAHPCCENSTTRGKGEYTRLAQASRCGSVTLGVWKPFRLPFNTLVPLNFVSLPRKSKGTLC